MVLFKRAFQEVSSVLLDIPLQQAYGLFFVFITFKLDIFF